MQQALLDLPVLENEQSEVRGVGESSADCDREFLLTRDKRDGVPVDRSSPLRVADLFCGCGGLSLGIKQACDQLGRSLEFAWAVDSDPRALKVYEDNLNPKVATCSPIELMMTGDLESKSLSETELQWKREVGGEIDILLAGPPCQGHSSLNNSTRHKDDRNKLYERVGRFAEVFNPEHVIIENVPSVVLGKEKAIGKTVDYLEGAGYEVSTGVVDLARIGVPQRRRRHVVVASRSWKGTVGAIEKTYATVPRSVRWAIGDLKRRSSPDLFDRPARLSEDNRKRIDYLMTHGLFDLPNAERPECHQDDSHTYKSMYGRLAWDEPAQTITTGFSSPGQGRYIHPSEARTLTPHEAARLQFFPDSFDFSSVEHRSAMAKMIGNAVPCKLSWAIGLELLSC